MLDSYKQAVPLKPTHICAECIGEDFLKQLASDEGQQSNCSYCGTSRRCLTIPRIADLVDTAFGQHYSQVDQDYDVWHENGQPVVEAIMDAAEISEEAASDIQSELADRYFDQDKHKVQEETEFESDSRYEELGADDHRWQQRWQALEDALRTQNRFFCEPAFDLLSSVFDGIEELASSEGEPVIISVGPGTDVSSIYRARCLQSDEKLRSTLERPDREIGPPPSAFARAGRMNADGISVFYGSSTSDAALGEVRPPVGSQVAVACFKIIRNLRLLDLTALSHVAPKGSIFDPQFIDHCERARFLETLSDRITIPVTPEKQAVEYLATQAVADFLSSEPNLNLDGIVFPSVQSGDSALNFVLFQHAARVQPVQLADNIELDSQLGYMEEEGWIHDYAVFEKLPPDTSSDDENSASSEGDYQPIDRDRRQHTLEIDLKSLEVRCIQAVRFDAPAYPVTRLRIQRRVDSISYKTLFGESAADRTTP